MDLPIDASAYPFTSVDQIGVVVRSVDATARAFGVFLGEDAFSVVEGEAPAILADGREINIHGKLAFAHLGPIQIELIEIIEGESVHVEFLKKNGEGIHHLGRYTGAFDRDIEKFRKLGVRVLQQGKGMRRYAYLDTKPFVLELIESD
jgi:methylmalonyl-CoA/ethylmalonyl-CoA epimerase